MFLLWPRQNESSCNDVNNVLWEHNMGRMNFKNKWTQQLLGEYDSGYSGAVGWAVWRYKSIIPHKLLFYNLIKLYGLWNRSRALKSHIVSVRLMTINAILYTCVIPHAFTVFDLDCSFWGRKLLLKLSNYLMDHYEWQQIFLIVKIPLRIKENMF